MVRTVSDWFPDCPPTWWEITIVLFCSFGTVTSLFDLGTISWGWVAVGFVLTGIAVGPAGTTTAGKRFGQWFRNIGVTGRASAIILFAVVVWERGLPSMFRLSRSRASLPGCGSRLSSIFSRTS